MTIVRKRPGASVRWSNTSSASQEVATYYVNLYKVYESDNDGDRSVSEISHFDLKDEPGRGVLAKGEVADIGKTERYHFDIAKDIAIAALRAIRASRSEDE